MNKLCNRSRVNVTEVTYEFTSWGIPYSLYKDSNDNYYIDGCDDSSYIEPFSYDNDVIEEFKQYIKSLGEEDDSL